MNSPSPPPASAPASRSSRAPSRLPIRAAGVRVVRVVTAAEMLEAVKAALPADIAIFAAAVADWRVAATQCQQDQEVISRRCRRLLTLTENPDILKTIAQLTKNRPAFVIGFAAETQDVLAHAKKKLKSKGADWIVANDVSPATGVMGGDSNTVHVITSSGVESWPRDEQGEGRAENHRTRGRAIDCQAGSRRMSRREVARNQDQGSPPAARRRLAASGLSDSRTRPDLTSLPLSRRKARSSLRPVLAGSVPTGLIFELPPGSEAQVRPRSGLAAKFGVTVLNSPGTIDADYRGEIAVILINLGNATVCREPRRTYRPNDRRPRNAGRIARNE